MFLAAENRKMRNVMNGITAARKVYPNSITAWIIGGVLMGVWAVGVWVSVSAGVNEFAEWVGG